MTLTAGRREAILSSLPYQIFLVCGSWYYSAFALIEFLLIIFKGVVFPYPKGYLASEIVLLFLTAILEYCRLFLGKKGNLTETSYSVILSILLTVPAILGVVHFLEWQTYVLKLDVILCAIQLTIHSFQTLFALFVIIRFMRSTQVT
ncbi:transmembrane protein 216-like [Centruroides vittatus]|uniref:transmembrane protein 216-like n=1 Tax=Centruroides vittatus TaxID=120091 RepID=UPI0035108FC4